MRAVSHSNNSGHRHQPTKCHRDVPSRPCTSLQCGDSWDMAAACRGGQHGDAQDSTTSQGFKARQKHHDKVSYPSYTALSDRLQHLWSQPRCLQDCKNSCRAFANCTQCLSTLQLPPLRSVTPNLPSLSSHAIGLGKETLFNLCCVLQS